MFQSTFFKFIFRRLSCLLIIIFIFLSTCYEVKAKDIQPVGQSAIGQNIWGEVLGDGYHMPALKILLELWGQEVPPGSLATEGADIRESQEMLIRKKVEEFDLKAVYLTKVTLLDLIAINHPVLLRIDEGSKTNHRNLVLTSVTDESVIFKDPKNGQKLSLSQEEFKTLWHGSAVIIVKTLPADDIVKSYSTGREVGDLQKSVYKLGFFKHSIDSIYGPITQEAVKKLQQSLVIPADGKVGPVTHLAIKDFFAPPEIPRLTGTNHKLSLILSNIESIIENEDFEWAGVVMSVTGDLSHNIDKNTQQRLESIQTNFSDYQKFIEFYNQGVRYYNREQLDQARESFARAHDLANRIEYRNGINMTRRVILDINRNLRGRDQVQRRELIEIIDLIESEDSEPVNIRGNLDEFYSATESALNRFRLGDLGIAIELLEGVTARDPGNEYARRRLISAMRVGDRESVEEIAAEILEVRIPVRDFGFDDLYRQGSRHVRAGDLRRAVRYFQRAKEMARRMGIYREASACDRILARIYDVLDMPEEALQAYDDKGVYLRRRIDKVPGIESILADILRDKGHLLLRMGQPRKALEVLEEAKSLYNKYRNQRAAAEIALTIAEIRAGEYEFAQAWNLTEEAQQFYQKDASDHEGLIAVEILRGKIARMQGNYVLAMEQFESALNMATTHELDRFNARIFEGLGEIRVLLNDPRKALEYFDSALTFDSDFGNLRDLANDANNIGLVCHRFNLLHQEKDATAWFNRSLEINQAIDNRKGQATNLLNLAVWHSEQGEYEKAENLLKESIVLKEQLYGADHPDLALALNHLAYLFVQTERYAEAEALFHRAFTIAVNMEQLELLWNIQSGMMELLSRQSHVDAAIFFGKQAVNTIQEVRTEISSMDKALQKSFLKDKEAVYRQLADLLIDQGRLPEAQQVMAMLKEEEYFDFIRRDAKRGEVRTTKASYTEEEQVWEDRYEKIKGQIISMSKELEKLRQKKKLGLSETEQSRYNQLQDDLKLARNQFESYLSELMEALGKASKERYAEVKVKRLDKPRKLQQALRELGHNVVTVHYLITDEKLRIILTTLETQLARDSIVSKKELNHKIFAFRQALQNPTLNPFPLAKELYDLVIAPIADDLEQANAKTLMVSLDGILRYLPLTALYDGEGYVTEKYCLAMYTAAAGLDIKDKRSEDWEVAGLGMSKAVGRFSPLPAVPEELEKIVRREDPSDLDGIMPGVIHLDQTFTRDAIESALDERYPVLHIASHFVFKSGTEQNSHLVLGDETFLTLAQIKEEDYNFGGVELLTLSACNTAMGEVRANGSEVESFGTLAQDQGAKGILATLWPVVDKSTSLFMQNFYQIIQEENLTKTQALQKAQLMFIKGKTSQTDQNGQERGLKRVTASGVFSPDPNVPYAHPFYWAPFILIGNWL